MKKRRLLAGAMALCLLVNSAAAESVLMLPSKLKVIDEEAFYGNTSIEKVILPNGATEIRERAFADSSLSEINLPDSLTYIAEDALDGTEQVTVTVNSGTYAYDWAVDHKYINDTALRVSVACSAESAVPEESVTWTAEGANGVEPYKYRFYLYRDGKRIATRSYNVENAFTYKFTTAGTYYVLVSLKDDDGEIVEIQSSEIVVSLETLKVNSVVCDNESIRTTDTANWTASAVGGEQPYKYQFVLKRGTEIMRTQEYSTADTFSYAFETEGDYSLDVTAKDNLNAISAAYSVPFNVALRPVEISKITADANSAVTESTITWTVETVAGKAPFTYDYEVKLDGITKAKATGLTENTFTYNTETAGSCVVTVTVNDAAGNTAKQDSKAITITTKALTIDAITAESEWVKLGDAINWSVEVTGGVKPLRYAFDVYIDGEEMDGRAFKTDNTYSYAPDEAGDYTVNVRVRDAANTTVELSGAPVHVYAPLTVNAITADKASVLTGEPVIWSAEIVGGKGKITYDWYVYFGDELEYTARTFEPQVKWAPMRAGSYTVKLHVTDENDDIFELTGGAMSASLHPATPATDFTYTYQDGTYCTITGYTGTDNAIILPGESPDGHIVQLVADNAFQNNKTLVSVVFADSIETMGSSVFAGCSNMLSFMGGKKLTNIGQYAFQSNISMVQFVASESVTTICFQWMHGTDKCKFAGWFEDD